MTRKTREEQKAEDAQRVAEEVAYNQTFLPFNVLRELGRAEQLGIDYKVKLLDNGHAVEVSLMAGEYVPGYTDEETITVYRHPIAQQYTPSYHLDTLANLVDRVEEHQQEQKRLAEIRQQAMAKLTPEEKTALGLK